MDERFMAYVYSVGGPDNAVKNYMLSRTRVWKDPTVGEYLGFFRALIYADNDMTPKVLGISRSVSRPYYLLEQIDMLAGNSSLRIIKKGRILNEHRQHSPYTDGQIYGTMRLLKDRAQKEERKKSKGLKKKF